MCGICGYISDRSIARDNLSAMNDTMAHRGPDDGGVWEYESPEYSAGLGHRRLSILDLSDMGHQPMISEDGTVIISYNGEIYNYIELRDELRNLGHTFRSECDTEIIPAAYSEWGMGCFARFNGMFAISLLDISKGELILAIDRIGKKPLYYYDGGRDFAFGSELKPLMLYPRFCKDIDIESLGLYLCNKCIRAPHTIFRDTYKLEPGSYLVYDCVNRKIKANRLYWDLIDIYNSTEKREYSITEAKSELEELLMDSVARRLTADVPVGTFLSSGIDSTLVTAMAKEVRGSTGIDSFTIGFYDKERNEADVAKKIARYIGTDHHELYMSEEEILAQLKDLVRFYDEPFSDSSQLPCMLVSKAAKKDVTVVLSGDGGDELCCGYNMYDINRWVQRLDILGDMEYHMPWNNALCKVLPPYGRAFIYNRDEAYKVQLFTDIFSEEAEKILKCPGVKNVKNNKEALIDTANHQERRMILDMVDYLPSDILVKMDRASMKYSLEVRNPLLDYRIIDWFAGVDHSLKYHRGQKKYLLKQLAYDYVPQELLDSPKKGFGVPLRKWLRTTLRPELLRVSEQKILEKQGIFDYAGIQDLIKRQLKSDNKIYAHILWGFYVFQLWYDEYIETIL